MRIEKVRRLLAKKRYHSDQSPFEIFAAKALKKRVHERKPITVPWFVRVMQKECKRLQDLGYSHMIRGKEMNCGWSWCWRYFVRHGYVSRRRRGCKRPFTKQFIQETMKKWLHCLRPEILLEPLAAPPTPMAAVLPAPSAAIAGPAPASPLQPFPDPEPEPFLDFEEPPKKKYKTKNSSSRVERSLNIRPLLATKKRLRLSWFGSAVSQQSVAVRVGPNCGEVVR